MFDRERVEAITRDLQGEPDDRAARYLVDELVKTSIRGRSRRSQRLSGRGAVGSSVVAVIIPNDSIAVVHSAIRNIGGHHAVELCDRF